MTQTSPDPDPQGTPNLDEGSGVDPGDTPPGDAGTSQVMDTPEDTESATGSPERETHGKQILLSVVGIGLIIVIVLVVLLV